MRRATAAIVVLSFAATVFFLVNCGGGSTHSMPQSTTVNVTVSDPAPCGGPNGPFTHVFLTITDVKIHESANAGPNDPGWVDLTPNLASNPQQVDMLGIANNQCFLTTLGSTTELGAGTYQQIRIYLLDNSQASMVNNNQCGSAANCVVLSAQPNTPYALQLSSESKTGIKIPSGQIAGGQFVVGAGQVEDLNIDFNACESIVIEGNGQYRLKPVLHAGEVSTTNASITGTVIDGGTGKSIAGGNTVVVLEQNNNGVDRVIMEALPGADGSFVLCPVPAGTYDVVIGAINGAGVEYAATVITGVQPGSAMGSVPMTAAGLPGSINGEITSSTGTAGTVVDLTVSALLPITENGSSVLITTPLAQQGAATATLMTAAGQSCPTNTDCVSYTLAVPAANPSVGALIPGGPQNPAAPAGGNVAYTVDALAFSGGVADCSSPDLQTSLTTSNAQLLVTVGNPVTASTLAFSGCQ